MSSISSPLALLVAVSLSAPACMTGIGALRGEVDELNVLLGLPLDIGIAWGADQAASAINGTEPDFAGMVIWSLVILGADMLVYFSLPKRSYAHLDIPPDVWASRPFFRGEVVGAEEPSY